MEQGTGKTKVAIELVNYNEVDLTLFITPFSCKDNIKKEVEKWGINCPYKIIGYETISSSDKKYLRLLELIKNKKIFIIADESIFIKNDDTNRFKRIKEIRKYCKYALILNATPITKNEWDLYNQMDFLSPEIINMDRIQFENTFFTKIKYKKKGGKPNKFINFSKVNAGYLNKLIAPYVIDYKLDFDKKEITEEIIVNPSSDTFDTYVVAKNLFLDALEEREGILDKIVKLCYISSTDENRCSKVAGFIKEKQIICYCNYIKEVELISQNIDCYVITGKVKEFERVEILDKFKNDNKPLIMTYGVGSFSLNLQYCSHIVFSSLNFDYGKLDHAKARIKRIGQQNNINYTYFTSNLGIDALIKENIAKKSTLYDLIKLKMKEGVKWEKII